MSDTVKRLSELVGANGAEAPIVQVVEPEIRSVAKYALLGNPAGAKESSDEDK